MNLCRSHKILPREVWMGWISSLSEAYNMAIYSFAVPQLAQLLFQQETQSRAIFLSYLLVLVGSCLFYPIGAIYYGFLGDRKGRQKTCVHSTLGLAVATGLMGLVPLGIFPESGWIFFLFLIGAQYFFSGGEYHGSIVFSLEHAEIKQNGVMSALSCLFAVVGLFMASGLSSLLGAKEGGIRLCFLLGGLGGAVSYVLKCFCRETPAFSLLKNNTEKKGSLYGFLRAEWSRVLLGVAVLSFFIVSYNFIFLFLPIAHPSVEGFDTVEALIGYGAFLVIGGVLGDRFGWRKVMAVGGGAFSVVLVPSCFLLPSLLTLQMILTLCACLVIGPLHAWLLHQFKVENRCRGIFISSACSISLFGGSTVPLCLMVFEKSQSLVFCSLYPLLFALGCLYVLMRERATLKYDL